LILKKIKMDLNKFKNAFKNRKQILEGIKNNIFKQEHIEAEAAKRWNLCKQCPHLDTKGDKCVAPGTKPCCAECGCSLKFKLRSMSSDCPFEFWKAVMDEETEETLNQYLDETTNK